MVTYVVVDWATFFLRIEVVGRFGMKQCGGLVKYLITKQLENMPAPLPQHTYAVGDKSAMRTLQAFFCMAEGETLTISYAFFLSYYIVDWTLMQNPMVFYIVPMKDVWVI